MKYLTIAITGINLLVTIFLVFNLQSVKHQVGNIKIPSVIVKTVKAPTAAISMTCTGTLDETLTGNLYGDYFTNSTNNLPTVIKSTGSTPINLSCTQ